MISPDLIDRAIEDFYEHDSRALEPLVTRSLPHHPTIYSWAADALEKMLRTGGVRDYWALQTIFHGALALQNRQDYIDLLLETLDQIIDHDGMIPYTVARALDDTLLPDDTWAIEPILSQVEKTFATSQTNPLHAGVTSVAIRSLGVFSEFSIRKPLIQLLDSPDELLAGSAALALAEQREIEAAPILLLIFTRQPTPDVITALGKLRARQAVPYLIASLEDYYQSKLKKKTGTGELIRATLLALGEIGDPAALEPVRRMMELPSRGIALQAALALSKLGDDSGLPLILKRQGTWEASLHLIELGHIEGLPAVIQNYRVDTAFPRASREATSRQNLLRELGRQEGPAVFPLLEWVQQNDFEQTASGWTLAEEARRAAERIAARGRGSSPV
jgi:HEAT repeat protein